MNRKRGTIYCRCGSRLAHDNAASQCVVCQKRTSDLAIRPPIVGPDFWEAPQIHDALAARHIGLISRAYRKHPQHIAVHGRDGISQETVAGWLGLTQAQVSRIENGPPVKHLDSLARWARTLRIPARLLWFKISLDYDGPSIRAVEPSPAIPPTTISLSVDSLVAPGASPAAALEAFRAADRRNGGGHLYAAVVRYLQTKVAPKLFGVDHGGDSRFDFTVAAALTEMAGWMAHDAGHDRSAEHHFTRSLGLARVGGDRQLDVHVLASMSHLAHHRQKPHDAARLARRGRHLLTRTPRQPELEARVIAMEARASAALGRSKECAQRIIDAECALSATAGVERSPWTSHFDEGSLACEAARCLLQLDDLAAAGRQAERVIVLRPGDRTRSRAFGQIILAMVRVRQDKPDEACAVAHEVLESTPQLGSYLIVQQFLELCRSLETYQTSRPVAEFLGRLDETLRDRLWLNRWLSDGRNAEDPAETW
ncbi:helix-turn-helix transcriptional regulator [Actinoplanes sp. NBRC 103695]|uniref:helix-turn-helix domain-containing protein n=1 Tax=Actinoplanes sp. NBRC 103695 TaxID=3032202 RepID=UPI00249FDD25|nr:helix-turn-helix transcriptional regulator [Actinoplanes sp. NBRC 103695]GLY97730.1 hypothetical protein Acsp02_49840 [Actinoplanes sp. NBRC 103695]